MTNDNTGIRLSVYSSIYTDPVIGHHLSPRRDKCPGSIVVRQAVADALAGFSFSPLHAPKENLYLYKFYELGYQIALSYKPENPEFAYRRGYEDWLAGLESLESSKSYLAGYRQAQQDDVQYQMGQEEIYWGDREYAW